MEESESDRLPSPPTFHAPEHDSARAARAEERRARATVRVFRDGEKEPAGPDPDVLAMSIPERMDACWRLSLHCMGWNAETDVEPRLQRSVVRLRRGGG